MYLTDQGPGNQANENYQAALQQVLDPLIAAGDPRIVRLPIPGSAVARKPGASQFGDGSGCVEPKTLEPCTDAQHTGFDTDPGTACAACRSLRRVHACMHAVQSRDPVVVSPLAGTAATSTPTSPPRPTLPRTSRRRSSPPSVGRPSDCEAYD